MIGLFGFEFDNLISYTTTYQKRQVISSSLTINLFQNIYIRLRLRLAKVGALLIRYELFIQVKLPSTMTSLEHRKNRNFVDHVLFYTIV